MNAKSKVLPLMYISVSFAAWNNRPRIGFTSYSPLYQRCVQRVFWYGKSNKKLRVHWHAIVIPNETYRLSLLWIGVRFKAKTVFVWVGTENLHLKLCNKCGPG